MTEKEGANEPWLRCSLTELLLDFINTSAPDPVLLPAPTPVSASPRPVSQWASHRSSCTSPAAAPDSLLAWFPRTGVLLQALFQHYNMKILWEAKLSVL